MGSNREKSIKRSKKSNKKLIRILDVPIKFSWTVHTTQGYFTNNILDRYFMYFKGDKIMYVLILHLFVYIKGLGFFQISMEMIYYVYFTQYTYNLNVYFQLGVRREWSLIPEL